jgi:high-affinity nickel-transport protein
MPDLPTDWTALLALAFVLGLRHGIDADHIASIDALTRLRSVPGQRPARWCGALFALGHGGVVLLIVTALAGASQGWQPPAWLAPLGAWISIALLAALGVANLRAVLSSCPGHGVALRGLRAQLFTRLKGTGHPAAAAGVGALFAASFDTVSLAAMFALAGSAAGGPASALLLGLAFATGMLVTDGTNGWWLAHLLGRTGAGAARASRLTATVVAVVSLAVATLGVARFVSPAADAWVEGAGAWLGVVLLTAVLSTSAALLWQARQRSGVVRDEAASSRRVAA